MQYRAVPSSAGGVVVVVVVAAAAAAAAAVVVVVVAVVLPVLLVLLVDYSYCSASTTVVGLRFKFRAEGLWFGVDVQVSDLLLQSYVYMSHAERVWIILGCERCPGSLHKHSTAEWSSVRASPHKHCTAPSVKLREASFLRFQTASKASFANLLQNFGNIFYNVSQQCKQ